MRPMLRMFVLAAVTTSATAAFAFDQVTVNVPFNFETHGKSFPAGRYLVEFDPTLNALTLWSKTDASKVFMWVASPAEFGPNTEKLSLTFDNGADGTHMLRSIRLAAWTTPVLDLRERHDTERPVSITNNGR
jgi:hypothetical protein